MRAPLALTLCLSVSALAGDGPAAVKRGSAPGHFVTMEVLDVVELDEGWAVLLQRKDEGVVMPIFIGPAEGLAIRLRLDKKVPPRPLTHDLLEDVVEALGARVVKIEVDDLKSDVFLGRIYLEQAKKPVQLDARPSDSIALALGTGAPIHVSRRVLDKAGLKKEDLLKKRRAPKVADEAPKTESL